MISADHGRFPWLGDLKAGLVKVAVKGEDFAFLKGPVRIKFKAGERLFSVQFLTR